MAVRRPGIALWALLGLLAVLRPSLSFLAPLKRRAALSAALAPLVASGAAMAEEAPKKKKKERPPEALMAEGYPSKAVPLNGRWSIVFGKKLNGKPVYKKDGEKMFLMSNECGEFQIDSVAKASCDGFGVKKESGWVIDGKPVPDFKVRVATKDDMNANLAYSAAKLDDIVNEEMAKMEKQSSVDTFRGTMDDDNEEAGDRLLKKMGAKIIKGM